MMVRSVGEYLGNRRAIKDRARELLAAVGLQDRMRNRPSQLSGGERQRVAIARALMGSPQLIFADEPTGNLDSVTAAGILDLLWRLNHEQGIAFLLVTHNEELARRTDRRIRLFDGMTVDGESAIAAAPQPGTEEPGR
jgi:predicted ABC-type transport system involved in lysophospholipase L1 biosynthesis ATPase subunit